MKRSPEDEYLTPDQTTKKIRIRGAFVAKVTKLQPPSLKRKKTPNPISIPPRSSRMTKFKAVHKAAKPPDGFYNEDLFDLSSRRLIKPLPVRYERLTQSSPLSSLSTEADIEPRFWYPAPIEDDIKKTLFLHPRNREIVWVGRLAEAKLKEEIKKYHRVKDLWLFQASDAYMPGYDKKAEFIASVYEHEMLSPWVVCWLSELIGQEEVGGILEHIKVNLEKSLATIE